MQVENNKDQIDCYQNIGTKLIVTPKYKDKNSDFTKLFSKMSLFFKFGFNKIELQVKLNISNVDFYAYFAI